MKARPKPWLTVLSDLPTTKLLYRAAATCCFCSLLSSCFAAPQRPLPSEPEPAPREWIDPANIETARSLLERQPGPVPAQWWPPQLLVSEALRRAERAITPEADSAEEFTLPTAASSISAQLLAELAVWSALRVAGLHNTEPPPPERVSAQTQLLARTQRRVRARELHLYVINTNEHYRITLYDEEGRMLPQALLQLRVALRDQRVDVGLVPKPRLAAMLYLVGQHYDRPLQVISGYRVAGVNATLGSRHGFGAAADFSIQGVRPSQLIVTLEQMFRPIGLGHYTRSGFIHLDDRDVSYSWLDSSLPGRASRMRQRAFSRQLREAGDPTRVSPHLSERWLYQEPSSQ